MNILVVEQAPERQDSICSGLAGLGYRVDGMPCDQRHDAGLRSKRYDIIVIDLVVPGARSLSLLRELREAFPSVKILIMSPACDTQQQITALIQGADEILVKPFDLAGLVAVLRDSECHEESH